MLPNFLIGGAPKCGTTSLAATLSEHPEIFIPPIKEIGFFQSSKWEELGLAWYQDFFQGQTARCGEATPFYISSPQAIARIAQTIPTVKWIYMLRNPIKRAHSHYWHRQRGGTESRTLMEVLQHEQKNPAAPKSYLLEEGCYTQHLKRLQSFFPPEQILVLLLEDFKTTEEVQMKSIYNFLEIAPLSAGLKTENQASEPKSRFLQKAVRTFVKGDSLPKTLLKKVLTKQSRKMLFWKINTINSEAKAKPALPSDEQDLLIDFYREEVGELSQLLKRDFSHWLQK